MPAYHIEVQASGKRTQPIAVNGKIYVIGGATPDWNPIYSTVEEYTPEGWPFNAIFPQNNQPSTWGEQKQER